MNAEREFEIKNYEATKSGFTDYTHFECSKKERLARKADFINGIDYTPDFTYPILDNLDFDGGLIAKKTRTYKAVLELEAAKSEGGVNLDEINMYTDYHEGHLKRIMLVEAARDLCEAHNDEEREIAKKTFNDLNIDIYGEFDDTTYKSILANEVKFAESLVPKNEVTSNIKKDFLSYFKGVNLGDEIEELLISNEDISKLHKVILHRYKKVLSVIPNTDDSIYYDAKQCEEIINKTLEVGGFAKLGWLAEINDEKSSTSTNGDKHRIFLPANIKRNACELRRLVIHEQEVHARTSVNGKKSGFKPLFSGTENAAYAEEGLGVLLECAVVGNLDNDSYRRARDRYITAGLALGVKGEISPKDSRGVFEVLWRMLAIRNSKNGEISSQNVNYAKDLAYNHVENAFRGTEFWMAGVIYTKLKVYYEGLKKNAAYFHENIDNINLALDVALIGKYDHTNKIERDEISAILTNRAKLLERNKMKNIDTLGIFELVSIPELGVIDVVAKIDTGAYSGAIHCESIKEEKRKSDGKMVLNFRPIDKNGDEIQFEKYRTTKVKSSNGHMAKRYLIKTNLIIRNKQYTVRIGLSDRSDLDKQILIGRQFLRKNGILVDVNINKEFEKSYNGESL